MTLNPKYRGSHSMTISLAGRGTHYSHCNALLTAIPIFWEPAQENAAPKAPNCPFTGDPEVYAWFQCSTLPLR